MPDKNTAEQLRERTVSTDGDNGYVTNGEPTDHSGAEKAKKRRRRFGDRKDGRLIRTISPMSRIMPYIMRQRSDACNTYADSFDMEKVDKFCRLKVKEGKKNFSMLHIILAAYVRAISQRPGINRFVSGHKIYARNNIEVNMTIKREMSLDSPDTCIKAVFEPTDTIDTIYDKFNKLVVENAVVGGTNSVDKLNKGLLKIPGVFLRFAISIISFLDFFGWLPKKITDTSPFHGSMIITSMGSLGIKPIYHHIYNFGNLPVFIAYGMRRTALEVEEDGSVVKKKYVDIKVVTDERICDGYYYASAFKIIKKMVENPELLTVPPEQVYEDID